MTLQTRNRYLLSFPGVGKSATVVFGLAVLIIGLRSHFQSAWVKYDFHKICDSDPYQAPCPDIAMERFYVAITVICFLLSIIGLIISVLLVNPYRKLFWIFDISYHGLSSITLLIAAVLHIVSAIKISKHPLVIDDLEDYTAANVKNVEIFLSTQKIIAGVLTIIEAFLYIATAITIKRSRHRILQAQSDEFREITSD